MTTDDLTTGDPNQTQLALLAQLDRIEEFLEEIRVRIIDNDSEMHEVLRKAKTT